jgi:hypothetical protein
MAKPNARGKYVLFVEMTPEQKKRLDRIVFEHCAKKGTILTRSQVVLGLIFGSRRR